MIILNKPKNVWFFFFRNNFTIIDALVVRGKGSYGQIKFSGRKPGSPNALTFEITDKHLKGCDRGEFLNNK